MTFRLFAAFSDDVLDSLTLEQARAMKADGRAYAINHGKDLRLIGTLADQLDRREQKGSIEEWRTVHVSRVSPRDILRVTTLQYQPS